MNYQAGTTNFHAATINFHNQTRDFSAEIASFYASTNLVTFETGQIKGAESFIAGGTNCGWYGPILPHDDGLYYATP